MEKAKEEDKMEKNRRGKKGNTDEKKKKKKKKNRKAWKRKTYITKCKIHQYAVLHHTRNDNLSVFHGKRILRTTETPGKADDWLATKCSFKKL